ncbi:undecaprenyl-diphosphate phosphatase [Pseudokineococcus marinus]|uniref:Undecaprenyl-diphosphatase n=1 Tax=Pseudokineococcus marinus TaxID=351215 RepID=A0A849BT76_9ACTN|nr:undecaprenyl-diphosphate phosphatase [Pseudokineococcus marinus]NNH24147.1 undecaprenyl-diphosphate phosphatase [Pseudokineococcus marinus]
MGWVEALVLGLVQGLTEFLPISSSAHVSIVGQLLFDGRDPGAAFTAIIQLGTEAAVVVYFWRDIVRIVRRWALSLVGRVPRSDPDARMGWLVILGSIPIGVLGLVFQDQIETQLRNLWITAVMLAVFGVLLGVADARATTRKDLSDLSVRDGLLYGFAQALALVPGVSRSGGTITAGLLLGYRREAAARYAFLLAIPAVVASGGFQLVSELGEGGAASVAWGPTVLATAISFGVGLAVIAWLLRFISTHTFRGFVVYRLALAAVLALLLLTGVVDAAPVVAPAVQP